MPSGSDARQSDEVVEAMDALSISPKSGGPENSALYVQNFSHHHYGATFHSTNHNYGPVFNIGHIENANFKTSDDFVLLDTLPKHPDLSRSRDDYFPDSRTDDVKQVWDWADDPTAESILWIHGPAGIGKSTLARHLRQDLHSHTRLAASAFLSDLPTDSWGAESVIRLIAGELGRIHNGAVPAIAEAVRQCHGAPIQTQLEKFILNPLRLLQLQHPLIVLMDGTDEWENFPTFAGVLSFLALHKSVVRFLFLGRVEPRPGGSIRNYRLERVPPTVMINYVNSRFDAIEWENGRRPSIEQVISIVSCSEGMFVWTAIVCALFEDDLSAAHPLEIMAAVIYRETIQGSDALWKLYFETINLLFPSDEDKETLRVFLGGNVLVLEALKIADFASLVGMRVPAVKNIQSRLKSLRLWHPDDGDLKVYPARDLYHLSFTQYLKSTSVPAAIAFPISLQSVHNQLGLACLRQISGFLPTSRDPQSLYLSPLRQYAVEFLHLHLAMGSPPMAPGDDAQWKETPHYAIIQNAPIEMFLQWADLFVAVVDKKRSPECPPSDRGKPFSKELYRKGDVGRLLEEVAELIVPAHWPLSPVYCMMMAALLQPEDPEIWSSLATLWLARDEYTDDADFVNHAVEASQNAVKAGSMGQGWDHIELKMVLSVCLMGRFRRTRAKEDIIRAAALSEEVLLHRPVGHPQRGGALGNLAAALGYHYDSVEQSPDDLDRAISLAREAVSLPSADEQSRLSALANAGRLLFRRFERTGDSECLQEAISVNEEALALLPPQHVLSYYILGNLAECLQSRFEKSLRSTTIADEDLERSTLLYLDAIKLLREGHPERPATLDAFANSMYCRFENWGTHEVLDNAICAHREALTLALAGLAGTSWRAFQCFIGLSHCLRVQFRFTKREEDIEEAVALAQEAMEIGSSVQSLHCLACALRDRFEHSSSEDDLEESLSLSREAYDLCPVGHTKYWAVVLSLARNLHHHSQLTSSSEDMEEATKLIQTGMRQYPNDSDLSRRLFMDGCYYIFGEEEFTALGLRRWKRL